MIVDIFYGHKPLAGNRLSSRIETGLRFLGGILILFFLLCGGRAHAEEEAPSPAARDIQERVAARQEDRQFTCQGELICGIALIPDFYAARDFEPAWSTPRGPTSQARALLGEISQVGDEGLSPEDYHYRRLQAMADQLDNIGPDAAPTAPELRADFDLLMTDAAFLLGAHLLGGRVNPETIHASWDAFSHEVDLVRLLNDSMQGDRITHVFQGLQPPYTGYTGLRQALTDYRRIAAAGGWPQLEDGP
jgi:murein L,D-transpeptidase YcbB/YkuD